MNFEKDPGEEDERIFDNPEEDISEGLVELEETVRAEIKDLEDNPPSPVAPVPEHEAYRDRARQVNDEAGRVKNLKEKAEN